MKRILSVESAIFVIAAIMQTVLAQSNFVVVDSARVSSVSFVATDTGFTGGGYRAAFTAARRATPTLMPYVLFGATYAERVVPEKIVIRFRSPLWISGVTRVAVAVDRGGTGDTAATSFGLYTYPSSSWQEFTFTLAGGGTTFNRLLISFSLVAGDSGSRVIFVDDIRLVTGTNTIMLDSGGIGTIPIPPVPELLSPAFFATGVAVPVIFQWNASPGANLYRLQVFDGGGNNVADTTTPNTTVQLGGLGAGKPYVWRVSALNLSGASAWSDTWAFTTAGVLTEVGSISVAPQRFYLGQNYPNPFNPATSINYNLPTSTTVRLAVYDALGREVSLLADGTQAAGNHTVSFDASRLPSGTYLYRITAGPYVATKRMILVK